MAAVAATASTNVTAVYGNGNWSTNATGIDAGYFRVRDWSVARGRALTDEELCSGQSLCLIGETIREELFAGAEPVGAHLRLQRLSCEVVGILAERGQASFAGDQDNVVLIPLRTFQRRIAGNTNIESVMASVADGASLDRAKADIEYLMGEDDDFIVRDTRELMQTLTGTTEVLTSLLGAVAAVVFLSAASGS